MKLLRNLLILTFLLSPLSASAELLERQCMIVNDSPGSMLIALKPGANATGDKILFNSIALAERLEIASLVLGVNVRRSGKFLILDGPLSGTLKIGAGDFFEGKVQIREHRLIQFLNSHFTSREDVLSLTLRCEDPQVG